MRCYTVYYVQRVGDTYLTERPSESQVPGGVGSGERGEGGCPGLLLWRCERDVAT